MKHKNSIGYFAAILLALVCFILSSCSKSTDKNKASSHDDVVMLSLSSDGKYVVTSNMNNRAYIWNIYNKSHRRVGVKPVNVYSVNFIPQSQNVLIQNAETNEVYIEDIAGNVIKTFNPGFQVYGEAITSDLKTYVAADEEFNVYKFDIETMQKEQLYLSWCDVKEPSSSYDLDHPYNGDIPNGCSGFNASLPNFSFTSNNKFLIFNTDKPITIWNLEDNTWHQIDKTSWPNVTAISPDNRYFLVAGKNGLGYKYSFDLSKNSPLFSWNVGGNESPSSLNFISNGYVVSTIAGEDNQSEIDLFNVNELPNETMAKFIKTRSILLEEGGKDMVSPLTQSYMPVVATSIEASLLVTAQENGNGIMVYQFNPNDQTFKLTWVSGL